MVNTNVPPNEAATNNVASAVSWGAIFAGATSIATLSIILLILGTGLGFSVVSPWAYHGVSATTFGMSAIGWLTFTQLFSSGMGGYLAGRLRTRWAAVPSDEVYFRDTAHGFLAWAIAMLITAGVFTSVVGNIVSGGMQAGATVGGGVVTAATGTATAGITTSAASAASGVANMGTDDSSMNYLIDSLFRKNLSVSAESSDSTQGSNSDSSDQSDRNSNSVEVARILINSIQTKNLPREDILYISQLVAKQTGLTEKEAEKRVKDTYVQIQEKLDAVKIATKEAADTARKATAYVSLWLFISLLTGAFVASFAATYGGRQRDS